MNYRVTKCGILCWTFGLVAGVSLVQTMSIILAVVLFIVPVIVCHEMERKDK